MGCTFSQPRGYWLVCGNLFFFHDAEKCILITFASPLVFIYTKLGCLSVCLSLFFVFKFLSISTIFVFVYLFVPGIFCLVNMSVFVFLSFPSYLCNKCLTVCLLNHNKCVYAMSISIFVVLFGPTVLLFLFWSVSTTVCLSFCLSVYLSIWLVLCCICEPQLFLIAPVKN